MVVELKVQRHTWGAINAYIVLSVKNHGTAWLAVSEVRVNGTAVNTVAYGGSFTGTTTHTLDAGAVGTITITYPFKSGVNFEFDVFTTTRNKYPSYPHTTTAP